MNKTKLKYVKFTKDELDQYVRDKNSCISLLKSEMHIGFPPWGFATFQDTLTNIISREKIGKFDPKMNGIVLDVRNIKVFGTTYPVHDDDPINHINIKANFYLFQPRIGATIKGIVKRVSHGHVAVIIYRVFNVSIRFNRTQQQLHVDDTISVRIKKFNLQDAMPYIEGELIDTETHRPLEVTAKPQSHKKFDDDDADEMENGADSGISTEEHSRKKTPPTAVLKRSAQSSSDSDSEDDDDSSGSDTDTKPTQSTLLQNIKIKQEKFSDSEDEDKYRKVTKRKEDSSSDSETSDDDDNKTRLVKIKKEKVTSDSSTESSDSDSDSSSENENVPVDRIKKEKDADSSSAIPSSLMASRPIKSEPMSDVEGGKSRKKRDLANISDRLEAATKKRKTNTLNETDLNNLTAAFRSPAMSSTMLPTGSPVRVKSEIQSEDERPKKKKRKDSAQQTLESIESELFRSFMD